MLLAGAVVGVSLAVPDGAERERRGRDAVPADEVQRRGRRSTATAPSALDLEAAEARIEAMPKVRDATVEKLGLGHRARSRSRSACRGARGRSTASNVPIDIDGHVLDGASAPEGSPVIVEVDAAARDLQPGDRLDPGAIVLADRLLRESDTAFGRQVQALLYRQSAGLTVVLAAQDINGKPLWVTFGDSRDYDYKVAALFVLMRAGEGAGSGAERRRPAVRRSAEL